MSSPAFPSPATSSLLVSTQWLTDHQGAEDLVVLDATVLQVSAPGGGQRWLSGYDQYLVVGHLPGAIFANLLDVFSDPDGGFDFARPSAEQFERAAASVGIDNHTRVIVYDGSVGQWASRIWWLFRSFGYDNVSVLDGGLTKWKAELRPTRTGHVAARAGRRFEAVVRPELWVDKAFVESVLAGVTDASLVCSLPAAEFSGEAGARPRRGHIPGSVSLPAGRLVDRATNAFLRGDELTARVAPAAASGGRVVTYCGAGIAAAASALALTLAGHGDVAIFDGSLNEWTADENAPLAVTVA
ncbi:sulfurtransferase [Cryobacterium sp. Sr8]|uniref:sulfurtransferase n=1 Tax=Cryobacterium sp. Sr8 TaxID=1259203 RepID=UPI00106D40FA|nr:rhodanese-like domain-containing protein [Cryobacterium sp. Sr8]TFD82281.1 sulfurtransferase [Cryobacterium sp. Sr8]